MSTDLLIESVSDTALAVAYGRALETERPDALFQDIFARSLAGVKGQHIYEQMQGDRSLGWLISTRTVVLDRLILQAVQQAGIDTVLNLAAGLDTRPYRLALPAQLRWIEVDLPAMLLYKQATLQQHNQLPARPVCQFEQIPADLRDGQQRRHLFTQVNASASKVLVITEGLLVYLLKEQVSALAIDLFAQPTFATWLSDVLSPLVVKLSQLRLQQEPVAHDVQLRFAPGHPPTFFGAYGWQVQVARSLWHDAHALKREIILGNLLRWLPWIDMSIVMLQRDPTAQTPDGPAQPAPL